MWYSALLLAHIVAALATVGLIIYILYILARAREERYRVSALALGFLAGFGVASGTLLALLSPKVSAAGLVSHIALYMGACLAAELLLMHRMRAYSPLFAATAAAPALASVLFFAVTLSYGF
jgi:hypothetical protein